MSDTLSIITAFGGVRPAARKIGVPVTTVASWNSAKRIPSWRWPAIEAAAARHDVTLPDGWKAECQGEAA